MTAGASSATPAGGRPRVVAIVQARLGSTRLPGKVLRDVAGAPMLARVLERLARAATVDAIRVATSTLPGDDELAAWCTAQGHAVTRGPEQDVLRRYALAAEAAGADVVVRITSDCPLLDPALVDELVGAFLAARPAVDYLSNTLPPRTWPRGLDVEVFSAAALHAADRDDDRPEWREHVTPFLYRHPERFALRAVVADADRSALRWTVDTPEDLAFVQAVYERLGTGAFGWREVLALCEREPALVALNAHVDQKAVAP